MEEKQFLLIKLVDNEKSKEIINRVVVSYTKKESKYYNSTAKDREILNTVDNIVNRKYNLVFFIFTKDKKDYLEKVIYLGECSINEYKNIEYRVNYKIESKMVIKNFRLNLGLDLKEDFPKESYLSIESSMDLFQQLQFLKKDLFSAERTECEDQIYKEIGSERSLHELSQKNEYCRRYIGKRSSEWNSEDERGEFQRDRERITHAKASRRLVDKAQIFTSSRGDHFRTRMTHTLEVSQIARGISNSLSLNSELVEAIALAHDIGHTPFGHQGERTLDAILKNKIEIIKQCDLLKMGGFKHTFQGVRVLSYLEEKYLEFDGLDMSYQVLEGVLKHTNVKVGKCEECNTCTTNKCYNIDEFLVNGDKKYLFLEREFPTTLEGQIVNIADEIAQRGHDLDDALASNNITINELIKICSIKKMEEIKKMLEKIENTEQELKAKNREFVDENDIKRSRIVSNIITFFIKDVIENSKIKMEDYAVEKIDEFKKTKRVYKEIIDFSSDGKFILEYLERLINKKVINSFDVSRFDGKSAKIIENLFRAYYDNIMILPNSTLKKIYIDIHKECENVIDFRYGDTDLVREEIEKICAGELEESDKEYITKRKIVVRNITDHIAGMTDNYAMKEYKKIFNVE